MDIQSEPFPGFVIGDNAPIRIMAVVNISKESFYSGSFIPNDCLVESVRKFIEAGADIIDVGGRSTAPWSEKISVEEEKSRVKSALEIMLPIFPKDKMISIDTQYCEIAELGLKLCSEFGIRVIMNDVSNLKTDKRYVDILVKYGCPVILMASKNVPGDTKTMDEIIQALKESIEELVSRGFPKNKIILDPGVGRWVSDKTSEYDAAIIANLEQLRVLGLPILMALSRKSFIGGILGYKDPKDRYFGTVAATAISVFNGAHIIRTHDVNQELLDVVRISKSLRESKRFPA
jgi:dihydropteroate synthase